jgi:hypothetical protein
LLLLLWFLVELVLGSITFVLFCYWPTCRDRESCCCGW